MRLNALLVSRDKGAVQTLAAALHQLGIGGEVCTTAADALNLLATSRFSAIFLDFEIPGAAHIARLVRSAIPCKRPVVFAMIGALNHIAGAFAAGADFVLYKPLARDQVMRSLRAGQAFMLPERRRSSRHHVETLAYLQFGIAAMPALVLDVNENGISIQCPEPLPEVSEVRLRFVLPATSEMVEATGDLVWADREGRAGMLFSTMNSRCRRSLQQWLRKRDARKRSGNIHTRAERARALVTSAH
ncbi:MAG TPA: PilZ domain-containing protein [Terriglobales bacterium]|nr:PilZ domain-containing protein [Terriglobales bacterium]